MNRMLVLATMVIGCASHPPPSPDPASAPPEPPRNQPRERSQRREQRGAPAENGVRPMSSDWGGLLAQGGVRAIQDALASKGFLAGEETRGELDRATREALRAFQESRELPATGIPDTTTVSALGLRASEIFRRGRAEDRD